MHATMAPDYEKKQIELATESITRTIGTRPAGWYSRYAPSMQTRNLLLDAGYEYDSDTYDDELPYWLKVGARTQLIVPYSITHNDVRFQRQGMTSGDEYLAYIKNAVQCVLEEDPPCMLRFGLHNRIIGHPGRALGLARVLDWLAAQPRVWVTRRIDIARHWKKVHPASLPPPSNARWTACSCSISGRSTTVPMPACSFPSWARGCSRSSRRKATYCAGASARP